MTHDRSNIDPEFLEQQRLQVVGRLVGGMLHEINNPLNAILMNLDLGLMRAESGGDVEEILQRASDDVRRCAQLSKAFQWIAGKQSSSARPTNIVALAKASAIIAAAACRLPPDNLDIEAPPKIPEIPLHPETATLAVVLAMQEILKHGHRSLQVNMDTGAEVVEMTLTAKGDTDHNPSNSARWADQPELLAQCLRRDAIERSRRQSTETALLFRV